MTRGTTYLVFVLATLLLYVSAREYTCNKNNALLYQYKAEATSFGGDSEANNDAQKSVLSADVSIVCGKRIKVEDEHDSLVYMLTFSNVKMANVEPTSEGWKEGALSERNNDAPNTQNMDSNFQAPTAVVINTNGRIEKLYADTNEQVWVRHMKKAVIELLNTKISGNSRFVEEGIMGQHNSRYTNTLDPEGNKLILRQWTQDDYIEPKFEPTQITLNVSSYKLY